MQFAAVVCGRILILVCESGSAHVTTEIRQGALCSFLVNFPAVADVTLAEKFNDLLDARQDGLVIRFHEPSTLQASRVRTGGDFRGATIERTEPIGGDQHRRRAVVLCGGKGGAEERVAEQGR